MESPIQRRNWERINTMRAGRMTRKIPALWRARSSLLAFLLISVGGSPLAKSASAESYSFEKDVPGGFPDATTTGVPSGTVLKPSGDLVLNKPGVLIEGLDIKGSVVINADNVTLKNCKISDDGFDVVLIKPGVTGAVVQNCDISNKSAGGQCIAGQGTFIANNIHDCADGIDVRGDNTIIKDNYIHNMSGKENSHFDVIQAIGGFSNLSIEHNSLINEHDQTSAVFLGTHFGAVDRVILDRNLLVGGGYTVYITEDKGTPLTNVVFTNNHIGRGRWGPLDQVTAHPPVNAGNVIVSIKGIASYFDLRRYGRSSAGQSGRR
jgi:hypothetical protein